MTVSAKLSSKVAENDSVSKQFVIWLSAGKKKKVGCFELVFHIKLKLKKYIYNVELPVYIYFFQNNII